MNSEISKYTISVYELKESGFDFGLASYEIFDENYRTTLNNAILDFYMFREIGHVNPTVWKYKLNAKIDLIMRNKYNALYTAKAKEFNPLYTMELYEDYSHSFKNEGNNNIIHEVSSTSEITQNNTINNDSSSETNANNKGITSSFPSEEMIETELPATIYVDGLNKTESKDNTTENTNQTSETTSNNTDNSNQTSVGTSTNTVTESYSKKTIGSASDLSFAHAMVQFHEYVNQFNLDQEVIDELKDLFIQIW